MSVCPNCQQKIDATAIKCPYCRTELKAYGHVGIPLYQAAKGKFLCDHCIYHADNTCDFPQRPYAQNCTLYQSLEMSQESPSPQVLYPKDPFKKIQIWAYRNRGILLLIILIIASIIITL